MSDNPQIIKRILIALDNSRLSEGKMALGEAQARAFGAQCILLTVLSSAPPAGDAVTMTESQAITNLNAIAARLRAAGVEAHSLVRYGNVAEVIVREAELQGADMVVIGANARRGVPILFGGNIAQEVLTHCLCPVLVVPPNLADADKPLPVRSFDEDVARTGPVTPRVLGLRTVAVARIVGSVGRASLLDAGFRIRNPDASERGRYERIRKLMLEGAGLPPVTLHKLGYGYYVLDGNHRVAAAKEIGQLEIEAEVTEYVPLEDPQTQQVFMERRAFEQTTGLTRVGASSPGTYPRLGTMIRRYARENELEDLSEAGQLWEAKVYRPVVRRIRALRLGHIFPDQRTADVFAQIAQFREREKQNTGEELPWEDAVVRFRAVYLASVRVQLSGGVDPPRN